MLCPHDEFLLALALLSRIIQMHKQSPRPEIRTGGWIAPPQKCAAFASKDFD
jgi:hypothetical protein